MELKEVIKLRKSVRKYKEQPVSENIIWEIFDTARYAPSACNLQPWYFYVITDKKQINQFRSCYPREWFHTAPAIIVACADKKNSYTRDYDNKNFAEVDVSIIFDHLTLLAAEAGLGTCWVGAFDPEKLQDIIEIKDGYEPVALTPLGYPVDNSMVENKKRKSVDEIMEIVSKAT